VSERTSHLDDKSSLSAFLRRTMHSLADHVIANSESQCEWLKGKWWLAGKVSCIYNGLDLDSFATARNDRGSGAPLRLVAVGRVSEEKNALNLIRGLVLLQSEAGCVPEISWVGERDRGRDGESYSRRIDGLLEAFPGVRKHWRWIDVVEDVRKLLQEYDALIHPSFYEGLPNVVCEALAAGMPVLASDVCDHPRLVADGERGFLFDPAEPASIATAIKKLGHLSHEDWLRFSGNARRYAENSLDLERMITQYEDLFERLLSK
jgi:glycosyltransferase involved in cell wall biosynthesis